MKKIKQLIERVVNKPTQSNEPNFINTPMKLRRVYPDMPTDFNNTFIHIYKELGYVEK